MRLGGNPWGVSFMYTVALVSNIVTVRDVLFICITIAFCKFSYKFCQQFSRIEILNLPVNVSQGDLSFYDRKSRYIAE